MTWYVLEGEQVRQLSDDAFRLQISSGGIPPQSHLWTEGMPEWVSAAKFLQSNGSRANTSRPYFLFASVAFVGCLTVVFTIERSTLLDALEERIDLAPAIVAVSLIAALLAVLGAFVALKIWKHPARKAASSLFGVIFLLGSAAAFLEAAMLVSFLLQVPDTYRMLSAAKSLADASIIRSGNTAIITGTLGPHLMRDFDKLVATGGPVCCVHVTSPGGLVSSAIEMANYLEQHRTLVLITGPCSSACILLAVASPKSFANDNVWFGFHHTFPIVSAQSEIMRSSYKQTWELYRNFLARHGVPEAVLVEAAKHGADSLYRVSALQMAQYGAIAGVLSGGKILAGGNKK